MEWAAFYRHYALHLSRASPACDDNRQLIAVIGWTCLMKTLPLCLLEELHVVHRLTQLGSRRLFCPPQRARAHCQHHLGIVGHFSDSFSGSIFNMDLSNFSTIPMGYNLINQQQGHRTNIRIPLNGEKKYRLFELQNKLSV